MKYFLAVAVLTSSIGAHAGRPIFSICTSALTPSGSTARAARPSEDFDRTVIERLKRAGDAERRQFYRDVLDRRLRELVAERATAGDSRRDAIDVYRAEIRAMIALYAGDTRPADPAHVPSVH